MKIIFNGNEVILKSISPSENYLSLVAEVSSGANFDILKLLDGFHGNIDFYENQTKTITYSEYGYEFMCVYVNGEYTIRTAHKNALLTAVDSLQSQIDEIVTEVIPAIIGI